MPRPSVFLVLTLTLAACGDVVDTERLRCGPPTCGANARCVDDACVCEDGYRGPLGGCVDIDECAMGVDDCAPNATCINVPASFTCACPPGFTGDGTVCTDVDECATGVDDCDPVLATCTNTPGNFTCACRRGYAGDGTVCADVDECAMGADDCDPILATCDNVPGAFQCTCIPGYEGNGVTCADVDECATDADDCFEYATCTNTPGSFRCACPTGYRGDGRVCEPAFDIEVVFATPPSPALRAAVARVEARWEDLIIADLEDVTTPADTLERCALPAGTTAVDDLVVRVVVAEIDGRGGALATASPRCVRPGFGLPFSGLTTIDAADVPSLDARGSLDAVLLHELGHILGVGTLWRGLDLIDNPSCRDSPMGNGADARFSGPRAVAAWQALGGTGTVPVENVLGRGSCDSHWRERSPLGQELMSPRLSERRPALSNVTLQSLADLGYPVAPASRTDAFSTGGSLLGPGSGASTIDLGNDVLASPLYVLESDGSLTEIR